MRTLPAAGTKRAESRAAPRSAPSNPTAPIDATSIAWVLRPGMGHWSSVTSRPHLLEVVLRRNASKYPPAEPGALFRGPLKAAIGGRQRDLAGVSRSKRLVGSLTRPQFQMGHLKVAVSTRGSVAPGGCPPPLGS